MPGELINKTSEMVENVTLQVTTKKNKKSKKDKEKKRSGNEDGLINDVSQNESTEEISPKKEKKKSKKTNEMLNGTENGEKKSKKKRKLDEQMDEQMEDVVSVKKSKSAVNEECSTATTNDNQLEEGSSVDDQELTVEEKEGALHNFNIAEATKMKLNERGVKYLFPIQAKTFNYIYEGFDLIAQARTGTGKTLSFALPLVEKLQSNGNGGRRGRPPKVLALAPTRELAKQVMEDITSISDSLSVFCIYGGTPFGPQEAAIRYGLDILVGTPGRILDYVQKGTLDLSQLKHVVLDEVDQMLDMGFAESVGDILNAAYNTETPESNPQTLLFSATLPPWVHQTAKQYMKQESVKKVDLVGQQTTRTATTVQHMAIKCSYFDRANTVGLVIQQYSGNHGRCIVFCQTKRDADELATCSAIKQEAHVLHGDIPQEKREMVLKKFREGKYKCLVTTDVAARGLDIPEVDLVIQCSPPKDVDSYIHRSGRTGRAGRQGLCICFYKPQEEWGLQSVERSAGITFKKIGAPTTNDLIDTAAKDAVKSLDSIPSSTLAHFKDTAETLIEEKGAVEALSAALAVISGHTTITSRSLQNSQEGFTTYVFRTNVELDRVGYVWRTLERVIPNDVKETISRMRMCKDKMGCIFDLPSEHDKCVEDNWTDTQYDTLEKATELPELLESRDSPGGGFNRGGRGRGFGGRGGRGRGSFGGRGGGGFRSQRGSPRGGGFRGGRGGAPRQSINTSGGPSQNKKITFD